MKEKPDDKAEDAEVGVLEAMAKLAIVANKKEGNPEKDESSDDEENNDPKGDQEDSQDSEEEIIESVGGRKGTDDEDDETSYTSKGPIQQRRALGHQNRATPYMNIQAPAAAQMGGAPPPPPAPIVTVKQEINTQTQEMGHFIDDPTLLSTLMVDTSSSQPQSPKAGKTGIPALPDPISSSSDKTTAEADTSKGRIMIPGVGGLVAAVPQPHMAATVDTQKRQFGVWLPRQILPLQALPLITKDNKIDILIQLDIKMPRVVRYNAAIGTSNDGPVIVRQFVVLKPFSSGTHPDGVSGVEGLLAGVPDREIDAALNLVNAKDMTDLLKTYGPNQDSMLMTLCCKRDASPTIRAQVFALVSRILGQPDCASRSNVTQKNPALLSALDYTGVANNRRIAAFLAELYYILGEDVTSPDTSGNTLLHMIARKGDCSAPTLEALLGLRLSHDPSRKVYRTDLRNNKAYLPIHHAAVNRKCPQNIIQMLARSYPACLTARTDDGSFPIHMACQYSNDPTMIASLLYYNRDVVNAARGDGFTPLHLLAARTEALDKRVGLIPLEEETQVRMIRVLIDHGADKAAKVEGEFTPFDLVKVEREHTRALLQCVPSPSHHTHRRHHHPSSSSSGHGSPVNGHPSPSSGCGGILGSYDPFISGAGDVSPSAASGFSLGVLGAASGLYSVNSCESDSSDCGDREQHSPGPVAPDSSTGNDLNSAPLDDEELDMIAKVLYNHPTIQAVMNGTEDSVTLNNL